MYLRNQSRANPKTGRAADFKSARTCEYRGDAAKFNSAPTLELRFGIGSSTTTRVKLKKLTWFIR